MLVAGAGKGCFELRSVGDGWRLAIDCMLLAKNSMRMHESALHLAWWPVCISSSL